MLPTLELKDRILVEKVRPKLRSGVPTEASLSFAPRSNW